MNLKNILSGIALLAGILSAYAIEYTPANISASIALKVPGNEAVRYPLEFRKLRQEPFDYQLTGTERKNQQADYSLHHSHREYLLQLRRTGEKRSTP